MRNCFWCYFRQLPKTTVIYLFWYKVFVLLILKSRHHSYLCLIARLWGEEESWRFFPLFLLPIAPCARASHLPPASASKSGFVGNKFSRDDILKLSHGGFGPIVSRTAGGFSFNISSLSCLISSRRPNQPLPSYKSRSKKSSCVSIILTKYPSCHD